MEVYAVLDKNNEPIEWRVEVVSMFDAYERKRRQEPVTRRDFGKGTNFLFTLALNEAIVFGGDRIEALRKDKESLNEAIWASGEKIYILRVIPQSKQIKFREHTDGRKEIKSWAGLTKKDTQFKSAGLRK